MNTGSMLPYLIETSFWWWVEPHLNMADDCARTSTMRALCRYAMLGGLAKREGFSMLIIECLFGLLLEGGVSRRQITGYQEPSFVSYVAFPNVYNLVIRRKILLVYKIANFQSL